MFGPVWHCLALFGTSMAWSGGHLEVIWRSSGGVLEVIWRCPGRCPGRVYWDWSWEGVLGLVLGGYMYGFYHGLGPGNTNSPVHGYTPVPPVHYPGYTPPPGTLYVHVACRTADADLNA